MAERPWRSVADGLRLEVRLQPGASGEGFDGVAELADGQVVLKVRVGAPPEGGKANAALVKLLAKRCRLGKSDVVIVVGGTSRRKSVLLRGDPGELDRRLAAALG